MYFSFGIIAILKDYKEELMGFFSKNNSDLVSVISPAYNAEKYIGETIESVLNQTYKNWEMILVDDKSVDHTVQVIENYCNQDKRITLIRAKKNGGPALARNIALQHAQGRYISILDSDDLYMPQKIELQLNFMKSKEAGISFTAYRQISEQGDWIGAMVPAKAVVTYQDLLHETYIGCSTVMIDRQIVGDFKFQPVRNEDYLLWLSLLKRGHQAFGFSLDLVRYRKPLISRSSNKLSSALGVWGIYRSHEKLGYYKSAKCFLNYAITSSLRNYRARPQPSKSNSDYV